MTKTDNAFQRAVKARYGGAAPKIEGAWNDTIALLLAHKSVRSFQREPIPDDALASIVAAAQSASTASNMQCWSLIAVRDPDSKAALAKIAGGQNHIEQCPLFLVWIADLSRLRRLHAAAGGQGRGLDYLESFVVAAVDTALAAQNAAVAIESLGLSCVFIGALRNDPDRVASLLDLPRDAVALFGLCVGYAGPSSAAEVKPRLPAEVILHPERYTDQMDRDIVQRYDDDLRAFQKEQGLPQRGWVELMLDRTADAGSLKGRHDLSAALRKRGFGLI